MESASTPSQSNATHSGLSMLSLSSTQSAFANGVLLSVRRKKSGTEGRAPGPKSWGRTPLCGVPHLVMGIILRAKTLPPSLPRG